MRPLAPLGLALALSLAPRLTHAVPRVRRASATVWYRYTALALPGADGAYHGGGASFLPLRALRVGRSLRWEVGAEAGARSGPNGHTDALFFALTRVGWHRTWGLVTPWLVATGAVGLGAMERLGRTDGAWLWSAGAELGADLRLAGPFGLTAGLGFAHTVEGSVHHDVFAVRAGVAVFP